MLQSKPRQRFMPQNRDGICYKVWNVVDSKPFEIAIMTLIALNAVVLMLSVSFTYFTPSIKGNVRFKHVNTLLKLLIGVLKT